MQSEVERNLNEMLILHEELLIHLKMFFATSKHRDSHHRHSDSIDSELKDHKSAKRDSRKSVRSMDSLWFRHHKVHAAICEPHEAADIAKVFGRLV